MRGNPSLARSINRPNNFKANNRSEDPPNFTLLDEQNTNGLLNDHAQFDSVDQIQHMRRFDSNHAVIQNFNATEGRLLGTSAMPADERTLQTNISQDLPNSYFPQSVNASTLLYLLLEHRQREIKTMLYLEEVKRSNLSFFISNSRNVILNPILPQGTTERLPPNSIICTRSNDSK